MRHRVRSFALAALAATVGCAGSVDSPAPADDQTAQIASLDLSNYHPAGQLLCDLINALPGTTIGAVNIDKPTCSG